MNMNLAAAVLETFREPFMANWRWIVPAGSALVLYLLVRLATRRKRDRTAAVAEEPIALPLPKSPLLRLSFEEAFDTPALSSAMAEYSHESVMIGLGLNPANFLLQGLSLDETRDTLAIAFQFSPGGMAQYTARSANIPLHRESGRLLPMLSERETKHFLELAKGKPLHLLKLAQVSALIVSAAHVVSGMDVVRRLEKIDRKLDILLASRVFEQRALLREVYMMSRERLTGELTDFDRMQLLKYRGDLLRLRGNWLEELRHAVRHAPDPDKVIWINRKTKWGRARREKKLHSELLKNVERLKLYRFATVLDLCLAQSTGTAHLFLEHTLPDELGQWSPVASAFVALTEKITDAKLTEDVDTVRQSIQGFTSSLEFLVPTPPERNARFSIIGKQ